MNETMYLNIRHILNNHIHINKRIYTDIIILYKKYYIHSKKMKRIQTQLNTFFKKSSFLFKSKAFFPTISNFQQNKISKFSFTSDPSSDKDFQTQNHKSIKTDEILKEIDGWIKENDVVVFMKGTKEMPRCGFSNYLVQVLKFYKINNYKDVNVLQSDEIRQIVKEYSNWPTFPQLYIKGEFIGGCDIVKEMHENGSFEKLVEEKNLK